HGSGNDDEEQRTELYADAATAAADRLNGLAAHELARGPSRRRLVRAKRRRRQLSVERERVSEHAVARSDGAQHSCWPHPYTGHEHGTLRNELLAKRSDVRFVAARDRSSRAEFDSRRGR